MTMLPDKARSLNGLSLSFPSSTSSGEMMVANFALQLLSHRKASKTKTPANTLIYSTLEVFLLVFILKGNLSLIKQKESPLLSTPRLDTPEDLTDGATFAHLLESFRFIEDVPPRYICKTCAGKYCSLYVGCDDVIHIWEPCTIIKYYVKKSTFGKIYEKDYEWSVECLRKAADEWNKDRDEKDARPLFEQAESLDVANCVLKYSHSFKPIDEGVIDFANSFWPGDRPVMYVYTAAFDEKHRKHLANIFCHELGHMQGIRHYSAHEEDERKGWSKSVTIGEDDELSVSNHKLEANKLHTRDSDRNGVRELYALSGQCYKGKNIRRHPARLLSEFREHHVLTEK